MTKYFIKIVSLFSSFDGKYNNLPADHFMCEENTLHLGVSDMVTSLILNDLEENETKMIKKSHSSEPNSDSCTWVGIASNLIPPPKGGNKKRWCH